MEVFDTHENAEKSAAEYDTPTKILAIEIGGSNEPSNLRFDVTIQPL